MEPPNTLHHWGLHFLIQAYILVCFLNPSTCEIMLEVTTETSSLTFLTSVEPDALPKSHGTSNPFIDPSASRAAEFLYPSTRNESLRPLYLMGFGAINIIAGWSSAGIVPAIEMAIKDVNERADILPGYQLILDMKDSTVSDLINH